MLNQNDSTADSLVTPTRKFRLFKKKNLLELDLPSSVEELTSMMPSLSGRSAGLKPKQQVEQQKKPEVVVSAEQEAPQSEAAIAPDVEREVKLPTEASGSEVPDTEKEAKTPTDTKELEAFHHGVINESETKEQEQVEPHHEVIDVVDSDDELKSPTDAEGQIAPIHDFINMPIAEEQVEPHYEIIDVPENDESVTSHHEIIHVPDSDDEPNSPTDAEEQVALHCNFIEVLDSDVEEPLAPHHNFIDVPDSDVETELAAIAEELVSMQGESLSVQEINIVAVQLHDHLAELLLAVLLIMLTIGAVEFSSSLLNMFF